MYLDYFGIFSAQCTQSCPDSDSGVRPGVRAGSRLDSPPEVPLALGIAGKGSETCQCAMWPGPRPGQTWARMTVTFGLKDRQLLSVRKWEQVLLAVLPQSPSPRGPAHGMKRVYSVTRHFYCLAGTKSDWLGNRRILPVPRPTDRSDLRWWLWYGSGQSRCRASRLAGSRLWIPSAFPPSLGSRCHLGPSCCISQFHRFHSEREWNYAQSDGDSCKQDVGISSIPHGNVSFFPFCLLCILKISEWSGQHFSGLMPSGMAPHGFVRAYAYWYGFFPRAYAYWHRFRLT